MVEMMSKGRLAVILSQFEGFYELKVREEQYLTDSEVAAAVIHQAVLLGDVAGKEIADLGSGTGVLGLGTWLMGAKKVFLVEKDQIALEISKKNATNAESENNDLERLEFHNNPIKDFDQKVHVAIQNPPFGTRKKHADKEFLEKATRIANVIYTFHKTTTKNFVEKFAQDKNFNVTHRWDFDFPLKNTYAHHSSRIRIIKVSCWRLERITI